MSLRRINISNFGNYESFNMSFPSKGVFVFQGPNGAGKSMIVEAVVWALFGRYIRASHHWSPKPTTDGTSVTVEFENPHVCVSRSVTSNRPSGSITGYDNASISEVSKRVIELFGPFHVATSSTIFHCRHLNRFATGGDAERKAVMEELLGVDAFDQAYSEVKAQIKDIESRVSNVISDTNAINMQIARLIGQRDGLQRPTIDEALSSNSLTESKKKANATLPTRPVEVDCGLGASKARLTVLRRKYVDTQREIDKAKNAKEPWKCPTCGTVFDGDSSIDLSHMHHRLNSVKSEITDVKSEIASLEVKQLDCRKKYQKDRERYDKAVRDKAVACERLENAERALANHKKAVAEFERRVSDLDRDISSLHKRLRVKRSESDRLNSELECLTYLRRVYGPSGARLRMIGSAFTLISDVATDIMQVTRGCGAVRVSASENMSSIRIDVDFGNGFVSYNGLSVGEQSATDFALLKALATVPGRGRHKLPYVYDDVFDALDTDARAGAAAVIDKEGAKNQVFVFSHDEETCSLFNNARLYRVDNGVIYDD